MGNDKSLSSPPHQQIFIDIGIFPFVFEQDVAVLPFSSGTTGVPKGVMLSQMNLITNVATITGHDPEYMLRGAGRTQDVTLGTLDQNKQ